MPDMVHKLMDAMSSCCGVPGSPRTKSELSAHQMAPAGVVAHSSSWTPAAHEPEERNFECREVQLRDFLIEFIRQEAVIVIVGLKRAFNLATLTICLILSKDSELHVERGKVQCPHFLVGWKTSFFGTWSQLIPQ